MRPLACPHQASRLDTKTLASKHNYTIVRGNEVQHPMMFNLRAQIVEAAARNRLPDFYWASQFVEAGGLMSYGESLRESYHATAAYLDRIVKGANPGDLPVTQPTRFEMVINLKTARTLTLEVPRPLLLRANNLIQ